jgi:branched-chain amino acid transport system ATP-binding protein
MGRRDTSPDKATAVAALAVNGLDAHYGRAQALFGISFALAPGDVLALLGRNGAGKSTILKCVIGLLPPSGGSIDLFGQPLAGLPAHRVAQAGIGYVPEERRVFRGLSVAENLAVAARPAPTVDAGEMPWTVERVFALFPALLPLAARRAGILSGGEQQMLTIGRTLMTNPRVLLLDEPSEGLAPVVVDSIVETVRRLRDAGMTILLSEQNLSFAHRVADRAAVIERGHVRHIGAIDEIAGDAALRAAYLAP